MGARRTAACPARAGAKKPQKWSLWKWGDQQVGGQIVVDGARMAE